MNILFALHQFFPKHYTGTERLVLNLSKQMQRMGHSVNILTYGITEDEGFTQHDSGFYIKEYEYQGVPVISIRHELITAESDLTIFDLTMEKIVGKNISHAKFDIVHVCHAMRIGVIIKVARQKNIPIVLTLTDFWLMCPKGIAVTPDGQLCLNSENGNKCLSKCYESNLKSRMKRRVHDLAEVNKSVDCVVSATKFLKQVYAHSSFSSEIKLIPFGKDYSNVRSNQKTYAAHSDITLGFMSTMVEHKGAHVLINAFNMVKMGNIKLKIYGDYFGQTHYYNILKDMAQDNRNIEFCGAYKYEDMADILDDIDVLVVPSTWWENSPLVLLRALAHKVPAIVSDLGGMTEVITDGENGFTFEAGNAESLAKVLRKIGQDPVILNELKARIQPPPRIEEEAFAYEKIYAGLIRKKELY